MMMRIPGHVKEASKVIGYFSYTADGYTICDGDACIIAGSAEIMRTYLQQMHNNKSRKAIKKTRYGEIIAGLRRGGAYAFDEDAYSRFLRHAKNNGMEGLPEKEIFLEFVSAMHFIRIQVAG